VGHNKHDTQYILTFIGAKSDRVEATADSPFRRQDKFCLRRKK